MRSILLTALVLLSISVRAQLSLDYYLPQGQSYDKDIPTPESVLGFVPGEWHVSHDQLVHYLRTLAAASDRIQLQEIGRTHENRPLLLLLVG